MRTAMLTTTLAALVLVVSATAQTPAKVAAKEPKSPSREVFVAVLSGAYAVPPVETPATGTVELTLVGSRLHYRVHVDSLSNATGAFIHIGRAGTDYPAVADLFDGMKAGPVSGLLASGTLQPADVHGTTMTSLIRALKHDDAYVTVHTEAHSTGELRGQLRIQPMVASR